MNLQEYCKELSPRARGFYSHPSGLMGVQHKGKIIWFTFIGLNDFRITGDTDTPEGAKYVRFENET